MIDQIERLLAAAAMVTLVTVAAPCDAFAQDPYQDNYDDDWSLSIYPELGPELGGAPGAPLGIDSRGGMEIALGADLISGGGWGVGLGFVSLFDFAKEPNPTLFHFLIEPTLMRRMAFLETEVLTVALGPSFGVSDGAFDSRCPDNCSDEMQAAGVIYNAHDSFVFGGVASVAVDHILDGDDEGPFMGIVLRGRGLWAVADDIAPARWSGAILLRFGVRADL